MLFAPLALTVAAAANPTSCTHRRIVESARERRVDFVDGPIGPRPELTAATRTARFAAIDLTPLVDDVSISITEHVVWPKDCRVDFRRIANFQGGVLPDGHVVDWQVQNAGVSVSPDTVPLASAPEPTAAHPNIAHAEFRKSVAVIADDWRIGVWREDRGNFLLMAFRAGDPTDRVSLLRSRVPVVDIVYLPAPDAPGGTLTILQQLPGNAWRWTLVGVNERSLRGQRQAVEKPA